MRQSERERVCVGRITMPQMASLLLASSTLPLTSPTPVCSYSQTHIFCSFHAQTALILTVWYKLKITQELKNFRFENATDWTKRKSKENEVKGVLTRVWTYRLGFCFVSLPQNKAADERLMFNKCRFHLDVVTVPNAKPQSLRGNSQRAGRCMLWDFWLDFVHCGSQHFTKHQNPISQWG